MALRSDSRHVSTYHVRARLMYTSQVACSQNTEGNIQTLSCLSLVSIIYAIRYPKHILCKTDELGCSQIPLLVIHVGS